MGKGTQQAGPVDLKRETRRSGRIDWSQLMSGKVGLTILLLVLIAISFVGIKAGTATDPTNYHDEALRFWTGAERFSHLPVEYPPLVLLLFSPILIIHTAPFLAWLCIALVGLYACVVLVLALGGRRAALRFLVYSIIGGGAVILTRFDIFIAALVLAAIFAQRRNSYYLAYFFLMVGGAMKLYPLLLVPVLAVEQLRTTSIRTVLRTIGLAVGSPFLALLVISVVASQGMPQWITYGLQRPPEFESVTTSAIWLLAPFGAGTRPVFSFNSWGLTGGLDIPVQVVLLGAAFTAGLVILKRLKKRSINLGSAVLAMLCVFIVWNKVLSPQYFVWILPLLALEERVSRWWILVLALTSLEFPFLMNLANFDPGHVFSAYPTWLMLVLALRNLVLVLLTVGLVLPEDRLRLTDKIKAFGKEASHSEEATR